MRNLRNTESVAAFLCLMGMAVSSHGATGCTLNDPDRDIKRLFPGATNYKTEFISIDDRGGDELAGKIEQRLGDKFDRVYETTDVPYAFYTVLKGKEVIGRVHGVNQKGMYGGMQIILATDTNGVVREFYYQKISSPEARRFRDKEFTEKFQGVGIGDFEQPDRGAMAAIADPSSESSDDFKATLRGMKKNLILLHEFFGVRNAEPKVSEDKSGGKDDDNKK